MGYLIKDLPHSPTSPSLDGAALIKAFRAACAQRGIDPVDGANSFQVAAIRAEQEEVKRRREAQRFAHKFMRRTWLDKSHARNYDHSSTEEDAIKSLREEAATEELRRAMIPLREVHRRRGTTLEWINLGGERPKTVTVEVLLKT